MNTRLNARTILAVTAALLLATARLSAVDAGQVVDIDVPTVNLMTVTGSVTITVTNPAAGGVVGYNGGTGFLDSSTTKLKVTTNDPVAGGKKITAKLGAGQALTNASLKVEVTSTLTGSGLAGHYTAITALTETAQALFDNFSYVATDPIDSSGLQVKYTFLVPNTNAGATFVAASSNDLDVTYTLVDHN